MSDFTRAPVGCVIAFKNRVIGCGFSTHKTSPIQKKYNDYRELDRSGRVEHKLHAEIMALASLKGIDIDPGRAEIYIYRKCRNREHGLARPCSGCMKAIEEFGIKRIYYSTDQDYSKELLG